MFKSIKMYLLYRQLIKKNQKELLEKFNLRVDQLYRLYTVINLPPQADTYGPKDGPKITAALLKNWLGRLDNYLTQIGVKELTSVESMQEIDEMNYLLIIRFKMVNVVRVANVVTWITFALTSVTVVTTIVLLLIKLFF